MEQGVNRFQAFIEAISKDCRCSFEEADELATDFAIDFAETVDRYDVEHQLAVWKQYVDEFMLGENVEGLTKRFYDEALFRDIIEIGELAKQ